MTLNQGLKRYYWELCTLIQCDSTAYKDIKQSPFTTLFLYKCNMPSIIVMLHSPTEKIHGWVFKEVEILQQLNDNPKVSHWKSTTFPYRGEMFLESLQKFNKQFSEQIQQLLPKKTKELQYWLKSDLTDVFQITKKNIEVPTGQQIFFEIKPLIQTRYINYFQMKRWISKSWEQLLEIANQQKIKQTYSFGDLFEQINQFINGFQIVKSYKDTYNANLNVDLQQTKRTSPENESSKNREKKVLEKYRPYQY